MSSDESESYPPTANTPVEPTSSSPVRYESPQPSESSCIPDSSPIRPSSSSPATSTHSADSSDAIPPSKKSRREKVPFNALYWPQTESSGNQGAIDLASDPSDACETEQQPSSDSSTASEIVSDTTPHIGIQQGVVTTDVHSGCEAARSIPSSADFSDIEYHVPVIIESSDNQVTNLQEKSLINIEGNGESIPCTVISAAELSNSDHSSDSSSLSSCVSSSEEDKNSSCESNRSTTPEHFSSSDSESESSDVGDINVGHNKVYEGCHLSVDQAVALLIDLYLTQKLSKTALDCVLKLVLKFLPSENNMPRSKHALFKYLYDVRPPVQVTVHHYCSTCLLYLGEEQQEKCGICKGNTFEKFYQLSMIDQIKSLFEIHGLAAKIDQYSQERNQRQADGKYFDICDGSVYKQVQAPGHYNLTLLGHTDGVSISNSSHVSLWPLEFTVCEILPNMRFKFVLVAGVWVSPSKPNMHCYLKPFASEFKKLFENVVTWVNPQTGAVETSKVVVPFFCGDAPVRASLQNILCVAGKHSCNSCEQKTVKLPKEPVALGVKTKKTKRVFFPQENPSPLRTADRIPSVSVRGLSTSAYAFLEFC